MSLFRGYLGKNSNRLQLSVSLIFLILVFRWLYTSVGVLHQEQRQGEPVESPENGPGGAVHHDGSTKPKPVIAMPPTTHPEEIEEEGRYEEIPLEPSMGSMEDWRSSLTLTTDQCAFAFPGLTKEIEQMVEKGPFDLPRSTGGENGLVQGRIKNGKLYILTVPAEGRESRDMTNERIAVLNQLHRAMITSPEPLPNTIFSLSILDVPRNNSWVFARPNLPVPEGEAPWNHWLMPHFSFWSWPLSFIGPLDDALERIAAVEADTPWAAKIDKVVWRGTPWFNSPGNGVSLRGDLIAAAKDQDWADVEPLQWETNAIRAVNAIPIEDFCKYKYIIYTEGVTYSGRLPYHQACASVILTPAPTYMLHHSHLMRPIFSSTLLGAAAADHDDHEPPTPMDPYAVSQRAARWPHPATAPSDANIVFVNPDWSDLGATVRWLRDHGGLARGIATRQRRQIVDAGYLSLASEACYWRALIRGWAQVARTDGNEDWAPWDAVGPADGEGMRWETFVLNGKTAWE